MVDKTLSKGIITFIAKFIISKNSYAQSYIVEPTIVDKGSNWITLKLGYFKCSPDSCTAYINGLPLHFTKSDFITDLYRGYFIDKHDHFYSVDKITFDDNILEISLISVNSETYFDLLPQELNITIMSYLEQRSFENFRKIKANFITDKNFWRYLGSIRFPQYFKLLNEESEKENLPWGYIYPHLLEADSKGYLSKYFDVNSDNSLISIYESPIANMLKSIRIKILYPHLSQLNLKKSIQMLFRSTRIFNVDVEEYLRSGKLPGDFIFDLSDARYTTLFFDPIITYDFVTNPNFHYSQYLINDIYFIMIKLEDNPELFRKYILDIYGRYPDALENIVHNIPRIAYGSEWTRIVQKINEIILL